MSDPREDPRWQRTVESAVVRGDWPLAWTLEDERYRATLSPFDRRRLEQEAIDVPWRAATRSGRRRVPAAPSTVARCGRRTTEPRAVAAGAHARLPPHPLVDRNGDLVKARASEVSPATKGPGTDRRLSAVSPARADRPLRTRLRAVLLDVGDTLVRPDSSWRDVYARVFLSHGITATAEAFEGAFRAAWKEWQQEGPFEASEEASYRRLMALDQLVFDRLGFPDLPDSFFRDVDLAFRQRSAFYVFPDVIPALDAMQAAGLRLAVVSNWGWAAPELLQTLELARHFEVLSISARVGYQKPHPAIFEHALELLAIGPREAVHVGDDPAADVQGARRAGIEAILIDRHGRIHPPLGWGTPLDGAPVVADMAELLDLLGIARPAELAGSRS